MTISATTNRATYTGNGATTEFAFSYPFHAQADLVVISTVIATGVQTTKALTTHYTISGSTDSLGHYSSGGTITFLTAPASTERITIYRDPARTQTMDLIENDNLPAETVEAQFDYVTLLVQRLGDMFNRALRQPEGDSADIGRIPSLVDRKAKLLGFNSSTGEPEAVANVVSGTEVTATGSTTARTLANRFADIVNVLDFGADPTGVADSTAAFAAAIAVCQTSVVTVLASKIITATRDLIIPAGKYRLDSGVTTYSGVRWVGAGLQNTWLGYYGTGGTAITIDKVSTEELYGVQFSGFILQDMGTGARGISGDDGASLAIRKCHLRDVGVYGFDYNVYLNESYTFAIHDSLLQNAGTNNLLVKNATAFYAANTRFDVAGQDSVVIEDGSTGTESVAALFVNCSFQSAQRWGLRANDVLNITLINPFVEANNQDAVASYGGIYIEDGANTRTKFVQIIGGFFTPGSGTAAQTGVKIDRAESVYINTHMRSNNIGNGVELGANVESAHVYGTYDVTTPISSSATRLFRQTNGGQLQVFGASGSIDVASFNADTPNIKIGDASGGQLVIGESGSHGAIQGVGNGTNFDVNLNPYAGLVRTGAPAYRTALTSSNYDTGSAERNRGVASIGVDTSGGDRTVTIASNQISVSGAMWFIWKQTSEAVNDLTIATEGAETVNGAASFTTTNGSAFLLVWSDGTNLRVKEL